MKTPTLSLLEAEIPQGHYRDRAELGVAGQSSSSVLVFVCFGIGGVDVSICGKDVVREGFSEERVTHICWKDPI